MKIVVVCSKPEEDQADISNLIGRQFEARLGESGEAYINAAEFGGQIILNPEEWKEVKQ